MGSLILLLSLSLAGAEAGEISARQLLELVEKHSPELAASKQKETVTEHFIGIAQSGYFPTLEFDAIESTGFPGSSGLTGVGGLMGSPYRSGGAYGVVAKETLWDFGRTSHGVAAARHDMLASKQETKITLYEVKQQALQAYYRCSRYRSLKETWENIGQESTLVSHEVKRFVKTGQRSVVETYLADAQAQEAKTAAAEYGEKLRVAIHLLSILTGEAEENLQCPLIAQCDSPFNAAEPNADNPLVLRAQAEVNAAYARSSQAFANHFPKLVAIGSAGDVQKARSVKKQDYAVAGAVIIPLFDGLKTTHEAQKAEAIALEKDKELEVVRQKLAEANAHYDETILSAQIKLKHLEEELELAHQAFSIAKKRYFAFQGTLVDLREALRNLSRIQTQLSDVRAEYLQALSAKALINGAL